MQPSRTRLPRVWHPILFALIPVLSVYQANVQAVGKAQLIVPLVLSLGLTAGLWALLAWAWKDVPKAALVTSAFVVLFFNFGTVDDSLASFTEGAAVGVSLAKSAAVLVVGIGLVVVVLRLVLRRPRLLPPLTGLLNAFSAVVVTILFGLVISQTVVATAGNAAAASQPFAPTRPGEGTGGEAGVVVETVPNPTRLPDIYYIVLDGYGRGDALRDLYDYDNSDFLDGLRQRGFFVADHSTANYCQTFLSIASSLNGRYLTRLAGTGADPSVLTTAIRDSTTLKTLKRHGYRFVTYNSGFINTNMPDADVYLSPFPPTRALALPQDDFQSLLVAKTPLSLYWKVQACFRPAADENADKYTLYRQLIRYTFDGLGREDTGSAPKLVFAHVVCPHPPFLFGADGADTSPREKPYFFTDGSFYREYYGGGAAAYVRGYRAQARFTSRMALEAIDRILRNAAQPPVIILQGDHGPGSRWNCNSEDPKDSDLRERMGILNAYYLPGGGETGVYADITPVNSFRVVLKRYFGAKLDPLPDESYFSSVPTPFQFVDVTDQVRTKSAERRGPSE